MIRFTPQVFTIDAAASESPDAPRRTITGIAAPYNIDAVVSSGERIRFAPGSLPTDGPAPKLFMYHQSDMPVGVVTERVDMGDSMAFTARISDTQQGREALTLAKDLVLDQVSVGVNPIEWTMDGGTMVVTRAEWYELSMVPHGAFGANANIATVAASAGEGIHHDEEKLSNIESETPVDEEQKMNEEKVSPAVIEAAPIVYAQAKNFKLPTPSEYLAAAVQGGSTFAEINARIQAAAPNITTTDTPGLLPEVLTTNVYDSLNPIRPFVTAIGSRSMPTSGATFRRPVITVRPTVTQQPTGQLNALDPSTVTVANNNVNKLTFGTYVTMSEQDLDWTDPASLSIVLNQLAVAYGQATDNYAVDTCYAGITQSENITDKTKPADWLAAIYGAAYQISNSSNYLPTHIFLSPTAWYRLGKLTSTDGTPSFPFVGSANMQAVNSLGTMSATSWNGAPLGLIAVVDKNMAADTAFIGHAAGDAAGFEFYEQQKGAISVDVPSTLGRTIAYRGYAAAFMADATKFCKLV